MRIVALAIDFDGTLAHEGDVSAEVVAGLRRFRASGRKLILVTGRRLESLESSFGDLGVFDAVVAENGALLHVPASGQEDLLCTAVPPELVAELQARGVEPIEVGEGIIGLWQPHETTALEAVRDLDLEYQVIFNKGAVMLLPSGTNKATGLVHALRVFQISRHNAAGIGDAENDQSFLRSCGLSFAVENALPGVKATVDRVTHGQHGHGVLEVIDFILHGDSRHNSDQRHRWPLPSADRAQIMVPSSGAIILVCGLSHSGKSNLVAHMLDELMRRDMQCCVVDPEGDYGHCRSVHLGTRRHSPDPSTVADILQNGDESVVVNLLGVPGPERQGWFQALLEGLRQLSVLLGRPHWLVVDEAHHVLYRPVPFTDVLRAQPFEGAILVTVGPDNLDEAVLADVTHMAVLGTEAQAMIERFAERRGIAPPRMSGHEDALGGTYWVVGEPSVRRFRQLPPRLDRARHARKYSEADLGDRRSFYFRDASGSTSATARNLDSFVRLAGTVDDATWRYHLLRGDYSRWFNDCINDRDLAERVKAIEDSRNSGSESREAIQELIIERYGPPA
jgi:hydroxymethylpyrimidine pyrophosphatase-like HAD family hydrolase